MINVVLPQPVGPTIAICSPFLQSIENFSIKETSLLYEKNTSLNAISPSIFSISLRFDSSGNSLASSSSKTRLKDAKEF